MKKLIIILLVITASLSLKAQELYFANYYLYPRISTEIVDNLAKYDMLIVDPNNMFLNYSALDSIKKINPDIIMLAYLNPMEIFQKKYIDIWGDKPIDEIIYNYLSATNYWWLTDDRDSIFRFDSRQLMLNMSDKSEKVYVSYFDEKMRYWEFITRLELELILSDSIWDGIFEDNFETIEWLAVNEYYPGYTGVDIDNDGRNESQKLIAKTWEDGLKKRLELILSEHPNYLVLANKGKTFLPDLTDGKMFENFPDKWLGTWKYNVEQAKTMDYVIINVMPERFEMALASALWIYEDDQKIFISIGQQDRFKNLYRDYKKLGKIKQKRADTIFVAVTKNGKLLTGSGNPFENKIIKKNWNKLLFLSQKEIYVIEMENGIIKFDPNVNAEEPNLDLFSITYY